MSNARRFVLCAILAWPLCAPGVTAAQPQPTPESAKKPPSRALLVKCDIELADWLQNARQAVEKKEYAEAIRILQALIEKEDSGFVPVDETNQRFVSLRERAVELLGSMPPEALEPYRRLYDPKAQGKYEQALQAGDLTALAKVAQQYRNTSFGPKALEALAAALFDRGQFVQAAEAWRGLLKSADSDGRAMLLTKIAVAYHLAGRTDLAKEFAQRLRRDHPGARAVLAGKSQEINEFLADVFRRPALQAPTGPIADGYPGWGGVPDGVGVMADTQAVLRPYWRYPPAQDEENLLNQVVARADLGAPTEGDPRRAPLVQLRQGAVVLRLPNRNQQSTAVLPAMLRPVIAGNWAIYRDDEGVVAVDLLTGRCDGKFGWKSQPLPMQRSPEDNRTRAIGQMVFMGRWSGGTVPMMIDRGRYGLTIGGGRLYAVGNFPPPTFYRGNSTVEETGSTLAAFSLSGEGKLLWRIGWTKDNLRGGDEVLPHCTYLCPPTYVPDPADPDGGRLYVLAIYTESYYLLCLDARTGLGIWKTQVAQTPVTGGMDFGYDWNSWVKTIGTPPAVADGKVFVVTNTGVVAAFDAQVGHPLWAYQYAGEAATPRPGARPRLPSSASGRVNPIIASQGRVVCMPADAPDVFALDAGNGAFVWKMARGSGEFLTAVDNRRICVAGTGLKILNLRDGKMLFETAAVNCRLSHPAVTSESILICDGGTLHRVRLKDYSIESQSVQPGGLMGNLVSVEGKLIAANPLGLCAYFNYEHARDLLTRNMQKAPPEQRIDWLFQRGILSFSDGRYETARKDFEECRSLAQSLRDEAKKYSLESQLRQRLYQTWVAIGNHTRQPAEILNAYRQAQRLARTGQEKAHMLIRLAKFHETIGEFSQAVDQAQQVLQNFSQDGLVDVRIGPEADDRAVLGQNQPTLPGRRWAEAYIRRLIEIHGPAIYDKFEAQAKAEFDAAGNDPQALLAMADRWPLSRYADDAKFTAAEMLFQEAQKDPSEKRAAQLQKAEEILRDLGQRKSSPHRSSALVVLMILYQSAGQGVLARQVRMDLADLPPETPIAFADIRGSLGEILAHPEERRINVSSVPSQQVRTPYRARISPPLLPIYSIPDSRAKILCDASSNPIHLGRRILVQQNGQTVLLDLSPETEKKGIQDVALTNISDKEGCWLTTGASGDGKIIAVAGTEQAAAFSTKTLKLRWLCQKNVFGTPLFFSAVGENLVVKADSSGQVIALDIQTGKILWKRKLAAVSIGDATPIVETVDGKAILVGARDKGNRRFLLNRIRTGGGVVVVIGADRIVSVLDAKTGIPRFSKTAEQRADVHFTPGGVLCISLDGALIIHDPHKGNWVSTTIAKNDEKVLAWDGRWVVLGASPSASKVRLVDVESPDAPVVTLQTKDVANYATCHVVVDEKNKNAVLFASMPEKEPTNIRISSYRLDTGSLIWSQDLEEKPQRETRIQRIIPTKEYLIVQALEGRGENLPVYFVIKIQDGSLVQKIRTEGRARNRIAFAVTDNRMAVETKEGITVFGCK